jgi:hypothetical protein
MSQWGTPNTSIKTGINAVIFFFLLRDPVTSGAPTCPPAGKITAVLTNRIRIQQEKA